MARVCRRYARTGCRFSKDEPGGCTTFTASTSPRRVRSLDRATTRVDARGRKATRFHRADGNRFVTLSRCNYTSGKCARVCARVHANERSRVSMPRTNERTNVRTRTRTHADASIRQYASLIIPVIIINCSDPRHADEIGIDLRNAQ